MEKFLYEAVIGKDDSGYYAYVPDMPGCFGQGETLQEVSRSIEEGMETHVESYVAYGMDVPSATFGNEPEEKGERVVLVSFYVDIDVVDGYVSAAEAARMLGVTKPRVSHMIRDGILSAYRKGRHTYVTKESVERRLAATSV